MKKYLLLYFFLCFAKIILAQETLSISGIVKDTKGEVLPGAGIYVSGYKIATVTNNDGAFKLGLKPGNYDLLVQMIGFESQTKNIIVSDQSITLNISLKESMIALNEVVVKPDPNRDYYVNLFKDYFIGTTPNAMKCKMLNPSVLNIDYDEEKKILSVNCNDFLIIENKALGYKIKYLVRDFQYNYKTNILYFEGNPYYEDLKGSKAQKKRWAKARLIAYQGSSQQFFHSLYKGKTKEDGFIMYKLIKSLNPQRLNDSLINAKVKKFSSALILGNTVSDSLNYWMKQKKMAKEISFLNKTEINPDTLTSTLNKNIKFINFTDILYVIYTKEKEDINFANQLNLSISRPLDIPDFQISLINVEIRPIYFYENGGIYNPRSMLFEGYWAWEKVADSVPMDYVP
ncbi:MAG: carboxypeptidase-like regulatory domain-containing protein [Pelobium sp.]